MRTIIHVAILVAVIAPPAGAQIHGRERYEPDLPQIYAPGLVDTADPLDALARETLELDAEAESLANPPGMPDLIQMDLDNDGRVTIAEWRSWLRRHRYTPAMNISLSELDSDGDGIISEAEYARYGGPSGILDQLGTDSIAPAPTGPAVPTQSGWDWGEGTGN